MMRRSPRATPSPIVKRMVPAAGSSDAASEVEAFVAEAYEAEKAARD